jgi:uncharacterized protein (DUF58 family)
MAKRYEYLDPSALTRLRSMDLVARRAVEGFVAGLHKSPHRGFSVEFAEHREYTPGYDLKHIDWNVFARTHKLYIKQYEEETNLRAVILLDTSGSMAYGSGGLTKFQYAAFLSASLAYLMISQQDSVGLTAYSDQAQVRIPPRSSPGHLQIICQALEDVKPDRPTDLPQMLHEMAGRIKRRSLFIVVSDLFDNDAEVIRGLRHLRHRKHEVIVLHVMDPTELELPFDDITVFEDMEITDQVQTDPQLLREMYIQEVDKFISLHRRSCREAAIDYCLVNTAEPFDEALSAYLARRGAMHARVR